MSLYVTLRGAIEALQHQKALMEQTFESLPYGLVQPRMAALASIIGQLVEVECQLEDMRGIISDAAETPLQPPSAVRDATPAASESAGEQIEASGIEGSFPSFSANDGFSALPGGVEESRDQFEPASVLFDQQTCEPVDPTLRAFQDDLIVIDTETTPNEPPTQSLWLQGYNDKQNGFDPALSEPDYRKGYDARAEIEKEMAGLTGGYQHVIRETEDA